jgi:ketosteroid isomerase-like protein
VESDVSEAANLEAARRYLRQLSQWDLAGMVSSYAADIDQVEYPNRIHREGRRRDRDTIIADAEKVRRRFIRQSYEVVSAMADGERVALEVLWRGVLAEPMGDHPVGAELAAHSAIFLEFRNGRIVSHRNYDCHLSQDG